MYYSQTHSLLRPLWCCNPLPQLIVNQTRIVYFTIVCWVNKPPCVNEPCSMCHRVSCLWTRGCRPTLPSTRQPWRRTRRNAGIETQRRAVMEVRHVYPLPRFSWPNDNTRKTLDPGKITRALSFPWRGHLVKKKNLIRCCSYVYITIIQNVTIPFPFLIETFWSADQQYQFQWDMNQKDQTQQMLP